MTPLLAPSLLGGDTGTAATQATITTALTQAATPTSKAEAITLTTRRTQAVKLLITKAGIITIVVEDGGEYE